MNGVTTMTSSISLLSKLLSRNSEPSTGISPATGRPLLPCVCSVSSRPAMAKVWPLPSSTVVSARLTMSDGTTRLRAASGDLHAVQIAELADLGCDMQVDAAIADRPSGRNDSETPKFL